VFDRVVHDLAAGGIIVGRERLALASHRVSLSEPELQAKAAVERIYREAGLKPPDPSALPAEVRASADVVDRMLKLLVREKRLVKIDAMFFHAEALAQLKQDVIRLKQSNAAATVDVPAFKERYAITRKFAIPLLEYLDRERVTRRVGDGRVIL
jgi:selenocysteine-specific elongation factor